VNGTQAAGHIMTISPASGQHLIACSSNNYDELQAAKAAMAAAKARQQASSHPSSQEFRQYKCPQH